MCSAGRSALGYDVSYNRHSVEADRRIIVGFIEPHFLAGFSGGDKACCPGVIGIESILHDHAAPVIGDITSTSGRLEGNATQTHVRAGGSLRPVDFLVNVTLNHHRAITRFFGGETLAAHRAGCAQVREAARVPCPHAFPIAGTTPSGCPLDQNLSQAVKGRSAAAQIVRPGGFILAAARCNDGFPDHGSVRRLLLAHASADAMLATLGVPGFREFNRGQVQRFALILKKARVGLVSELPDANVRRAHLTPVADLRRALDPELARLGHDTSWPFSPRAPSLSPPSPVRPDGPDARNCLASSRAEPVAQKSRAAWRTGRPVGASSTSRDASARTTRPKNPVARSYFG